MADLSAYLDFTVVLDFRQGKLLLNDTSSYPALVANNITGIITTIQPDNILRQGVWTAPDIVYSGSALTQGNIELRRQSNNQPQQGTYTITYQVDHPSYTPTTKTKIFVLSYQSAVLSITELFDVFTPSLKLKDASVYTANGFNSPVITRAWAATIGTVGSTSGSGAVLDLVLSSHYYDAAYAVTLTTDLTYQHSTYTYLTVVDRVTASYATTANTPPSWPVLEGYLKAIKLRYDTLQSCEQTPQAREDYEFAAAHLEAMRRRICNGDVVNIYPQIQDFLNVYNQYKTSTYVNTNIAIPTYDLTGCNCGTGFGTTDSRISSTDIGNWNTAFASITPDDLSYIVGTTFGAPTAGQTTFALIAFTGRRVRLYLGTVKQSNIDKGTGEPYYSKPLANNTLQLFNYSWQTGDFVQFEYY